MTHVQVFFRKSLSKATFERKLSSVSLALEILLRILLGGFFGVRVQVGSLRHTGCRAHGSSLPFTLLLWCFRTLTQADLYANNSGC